MPPSPLDGFADSESLACDMTTATAIPPPTSTSKAMMPPMISAQFAAGCKESASAILSIARLKRADRITPWQAAEPSLSRPPCPMKTSHHQMTWTLTRPKNRTIRPNRRRRLSRLTGAKDEGKLFLAMVVVGVDDEMMLVVVVALLASVAVRSTRRVQNGRERGGRAAANGESVSSWSMVHRTARASSLTLANTHCKPTSEDASSPKRRLTPDSALARPAVREGKCVFFLRNSVKCHQHTTSTPTSGASSLVSLLAASSLRSLGLGRSYPWRVQQGGIVQHPSRHGKKVQYPDLFEGASPQTHLRR